MLASTLLLVASTAFSVIAHPTQPAARRQDADNDAADLDLTGPVCVPQHVAHTLSVEFGSLISGFSTAVANSILAPNFIDDSGSIDSLAGLPDSVVIFPSRAAFIAGQSQQPPVPFQVLQVEPAACHTVTFRWAAQPGSGANNVRGINVFKVALKPASARVNGNDDDAQNWWMKKNFSEFNTIAWAKDIGGTVTLPPPPTSS